MSKMYPIHIHQIELIREYELELEYELQFQNTCSNT